MSRDSCRWSRPAWLIMVLPALFAGTVPAAPVRAQEWGIPPTVLRRGDLPDHARLLLRDLHRPVELTLVDGSRLRGIMADVSATDLTLEMNSLPLAQMRTGLAWSRISEIRIDRKARLLEGVLVGSAAGAIGGAFTARDGDPRREILGADLAEPVWESLLTGAAAGVVMGLLRGWDYTLPITPQTTNLVGSLDPGRNQIRPITRIVSSVPLWSGVLADVEESLVAGTQFPYDPGMLAIDRPWHGYNATSVALETVVPRRGKWWLRGRMEYFVLPRLTLTSATMRFIDTPEVGPFDLWREYQAQRFYTGISRPLAGPGRLPVAELSLLIGIERTTLRTGAVNESDPALNLSSRERFWRPLLYAGGSLSIIRRPDVSISLRAEVVMGNGFETARLVSPDSGLFLPGHRIRPMALHVGFDFILPRF